METYFRVRQQYPPVFRVDGGLPLGIAAKDALGVVMVDMPQPEQLGTSGLYRGKHLLNGFGCEGKALQQSTKLGCAWYRKARRSACFCVADDIDHSIPARPCQRYAERHCDILL